MQGERPRRAPQQRLPAPVLQRRYQQRHLAQGVSMLRGAQQAPPAC